MIPTRNSIQFESDVLMSYHKSNQLFLEKERARVGVGGMELYYFDMKPVSKIK